MAKVVYAKLSPSSPASDGGDIYLDEYFAKFFFQHDEVNIPFSIYSGCGLAIYEGSLTADLMSRLTTRMRHSFSQQRLMSGCGREACVSNFSKGCRHFKLPLRYLSRVIF